MDDNQLPKQALQIFSTVTSGGSLKVELTDVIVPEPSEGEVIVRVEAAPINPSDIIAMLMSVDPTTAVPAGTPEQPSLVFPLQEAALRLQARRIGQRKPIGLECAGRVIAVGKGADGLYGKLVGVLHSSGGTFAQYCAVTASMCVPLPEGTSAHDGAALFVNPLTALAIAEMVWLERCKGLIHTAAASNLGQMLVKICRDDQIPLVNVVRRDEHVALLRGLGATHVCNATSPTFHDDLVAAIRETGAMLAFDATGGGALAGELLRAMEEAACTNSVQISSYGSAERKRVYVYGHLEKSPLQLTNEGFGTNWSVCAWSMPPVLKRIGEARAAELRQRVVRELKGTFASHYAAEISLYDVVQKDSMLAYSGQSTGQKYMLNPWLDRGLPKA